ncbi:TonB-dependent receptor [Ideonella azotifigens]|uniref:TonB-dependent receptor n=1 Tax=Ideonella azotifigens TaxID=513160 RepID=A0ABP3VBG3_9BURK|nr:TonB-dependent receptor [Ideonella azotifigens]MCD2342673.1 TonB-dependent receptor [Ideonella azotifigens]
MQYLPCRAHHRPLALAALIACGPALHAQTSPATTLQTVEVVGTTPLPGTGVPKDQIPSNVQTADGQRLRQLQSLNLPEFMASQLASVNINETQGNPFQMDVNYRGFTASPLLGTPQGLSVYLDGVRVNEPFGDVVNWDMIPSGALANVALLPGSNPLFGLNTLGGALVLQTKSGDTHPGGELEVRGGSFGRVSTEFSYGKKLGEHGHLFAALGSFDEDGWRAHSPSRVRQLFVKGGEHAPDYSWDLSLLHGQSRLIGNGLLPESMLAQDRAQIYTRPDQTRNRVTMLSLNATRQFGNGFELASTVYARRVRASTVNGDLNDDYDPPDTPESGVENRTRTKERSEGLALQLSKTAGAHRLSVGLSYDRARNDFEQSEAEGVLDATRAVVVTEDAETNALIAGTSRTASVFMSDIVTLAPGLNLTLSGRYNDTRVRTDDLGRSTLGLDTTLDGEGRFKKFNPAAGLTWRLTPALTAFGGFSQGNRAPSPIELGCSDPDNACVLPNALQGDPPLKQVVARTLEAGLRGSIGTDMRWNASVFRTENRDDLLFISNGRSAGYFTNFGRTQRQGVELGVSQHTSAVDWRLSYSHLRATFESSACILAAANSSAGTSTACAGADEIEVRPGNRLPGLPAHSLKLTIDAPLLPDWRVGAQLAAYSSQFVRGNENNAHQPDGVDFFGAGKVGGFALVNLTTSWQFGAGWELFAKVSNVFDRRHSSGGLLAESAFDSRGNLLAPAEWRNEQFSAPGAPRALWIGGRWRFGASE